MEYRTLGTSALKISTVGLGTWALGDDFWGRVDDAQSVRAIQAGIDAGINFIDTAPAYGAGHSEEVVGKAIQGRRDRVVLATKVGIARTKDSFGRNLKPESVRKEVDQSLKLLGTDVIDLWQIHWPDPNTPIEETIGEINRIKERGKIRYIGVSNFDRALLEKARKLAEVVSLQPHYSLLERAAERELLPYCGRESVGVIGYGTLAGGLLTGKFREVPAFEGGDHRGEFYGFFKEPQFGKARKLVGVLEGIATERGKTAAQIAINWAVRRPAVTCALVGAKSPAQARENAGAGDFALSPGEMDRIEAACKEAGLAS